MPRVSARITQQRRAAAAAAATPEAPAQRAAPAAPVTAAPPPRRAPPAQNRGGAARRAAAAIAAVAHQVQFALTPYRAKPGIIDYSTQEGRKFYDKATAALNDDRFDCKADNLTSSRVWME